MRIAELQIKEFQRIVINETPVWCLGAYDRVFISRILKVFQNHSGMHMNITVFDKKLSNITEENKHLNAIQVVDIYHSWTTEEEALQEQKIIKELLENDSRNI
jgi:hypothetical protein